MRRCLEGMVLLMVGLAAAAQAQVTVLDQPVDAAGQPASGYAADEGCDLQTAGNFAQNASKADNFTVGAAVEVTSVTLWGQFLDQSGGPLNATPPATLPYSFLFHEDSAGSPGAVVATRADVVSDVSFAFAASSFDIYEVTATFAPVLLAPGTYWLEVFADTTVAPSPGCFLWRSGSAGTATLPDIASSSDTPGVSWTTLDDVLSLVVEGQEPAPSADLLLDKTASVAAAAVGDVFDYVLTVDNDGPDAASNVVVTDTLPAAVAFVSSDCGAGEAAGVVTWNVGALAAGAGASCTVSVQVLSAGTLVNSALATADQNDPDAGSNAAEAVVEARAAAVGIPTLGQWGLALLTLALMAVGLLRLRW
jgi:uncharacterized repeat protein (TIGR01451 family)